MQRPMQLLQEDKTSSEKSIDLGKDAPMTPSSGDYDYLSSNHKHNKKGRKRNKISNALSIAELIQERVVPKWKDYLRYKSERGVSNTPKARSDTIWKKMLRDVREFFRILFRNRFHYLEFKDQKNAYR
jgi:hypothetical protein